MRARRILAPVVAALDAVTILLAAIAAAAAVLMAGAYVWEVAARYVFGAPTDWAHDLVTYLLCATVMLALPEVTRRNGHVAVTVLSDRAPARIAPPLLVLLALVSAAVCLAAAWILLGENLRQFRRGIETLATLPVPKWWISSMITLGLSLSGLQFLVSAAGLRAPCAKPAGAA